jgi:hypothetical protein
MKVVISAGASNPKLHEIVHKDLWNFSFDFLR